MLARLQQVVVLVSAGAGLAWVLLSLRAGWGPWWAAAGLLLAALPMAPVLALEFVLLAAFGRDASVPRASAVQLLRAWAGEVWASWRVFSRDQPFFADAEPDVPGMAGRTSVLLVHGNFCNRGIWRPWLRRLRASGVPCTALTLAPAFGSIDDWAPAIDAAVARLRLDTGRAPVVVAHSMGGLAVRAWLAGASAAARPGLRRVITIATPHQGTWMARFGHSRNARQMRSGQAWLSGLGAAELAAGLATPPAAAAAGQRAGFTCFYSHADNIVFPAATATLAGADNRHLPAVAHVAMVQHPAVWAELQRWLDEPAPA